MNGEYWLSRWAKNKAGFHQMHVNAHLERWIDRLELAGGDSIFVPLAGKSRDMLWLAERGFRVLGVELSTIAVEAFFVEGKLDPTIEEHGAFTLYSSGSIRLLRGDFFDLTQDDLAGTAAVYDRASLIAFPPAMRERYARHLASIIPSGARILLVTVEYPDAEMDGPPFSVPEQEVRQIFGDHFTIGHLDERDVLAENERFRQRGLTRLSEQVYLLQRI